MAKLQFRRGSSFTSLDTSELFFNDATNTVNIGVNGSQHIVLSSLNTLNTGSFNVTGDLTAKGNISASNIQVENDIYLKGSIFIGDNDQVDTLFISASLSGSLIPDATELFDIGRGDKQWRHAYFSTASIGTLITQGASSVTDLEVTGTSSLGFVAGVNNTMSGFSSSLDTRITSLVAETGSYAKVDETNIFTEAQTFTEISASSVSASSYIGDGSQLINITASLVEYENVVNKPTLVSGSSQIDLTQTTNYSSGIVDILNQETVISGSSQVNADTIQNFDENVKDKLDADNVFSSSIQVNADTIQNFDENVKDKLDVEGVFSGSSQVNADTITNFDTNVKDKLNIEGVFSGSSQVNADTIQNFDTNVKDKLNTDNVVSGSSQITSSLDGRYAVLDGENSFTGDLTLIGTGSFNNDIRIGGTLTTIGASSFESTVDIIGDTKFQSDLTLIGSASLNDNVRIGGNLTTIGNSTLLGSSSISGDLDVSNNTIISGILEVTGDTTLSSDLTLIGTGSFNNDVRVAGSFSTIGDTILSSDLTLIGSASLNDNVRVGGDLDVEGTGSISGDLDVVGNSTISGTSTVTGLGTFQNDVNILGDSTLSGDLDVTGTGSFAGNVIVGGNLTVFGSSSRIESVDLFIEDKVITLASGSTTLLEADGAGFEISTIGRSFVYSQAIDGFRTDHTIEAGNGFIGDGSQLTNVTASLVDYSNVANKPTLVSGSSQIDLTQTTNYSSGIIDILNQETVISGSSQVNADTITNFDTNVKDKLDEDGVFSGSSQVNADTIQNFDENVKDKLNVESVFSGSSQVNADTITNFDTNVKDKLNVEGVISGSSQVTSSLDGRYAVLDGDNILIGIQEIDGNVNITGSITSTDWTDVVITEAQISDLQHYTDADVKNKLNIEGVISGSSQVNADTITNFDTNVKDKLNADTVVSGSSQIDLTQTTNYSSGIVDILNINTVVSGSSQVTDDLDVRYTLRGGDNVISGSSQLTSSYDDRYAKSQSLYDLENSLGSAAYFNVTGSINDDPFSVPTTQAVHERLEEVNAGDITDVNTTEFYSSDSTGILHTGDGTASPTGSYYGKVGSVVMAIDTGSVHFTGGIKSKLNADGVLSGSIETTGNFYLTDLSFNTSDGILTATVTGSTNQTVDLDGRYLTDYTVTEDDVTQYSGSLTIFESQISDLLSLNNIRDLDESLGVPDFWKIPLQDSDTGDLVSITPDDLIGDKVTYLEFSNHTDDTDIHFTQADISITESQISDLDHYTTTDFNTDFSGKSTTDLTEGTNLYYTDGRVKAKLDADNVLSGSINTDNFYVTNLGFDTGTGVLTATVTGSTNQTVDLDGRYQEVSEKGQAGGYAPLDGSSKISTTYLPQIALTEVFVVADITARDALTVEEGDVAIVNDASADPDVDSGGASYIYDGTDWQLLKDPTEAVTSVNGETGTVVLTTTDIGEGSNLYYTDSRVKTKLNTEGVISGSSQLTDTFAVLDGGNNFTGSQSISGSITTFGNEILLNSVGNRLFHTTGPNIYRSLYLGSNSGGNITTANTGYNTAIGQDAMAQATDDTEGIIAVGYRAGRYIGTTTYSFDNILIGRGTGQYIEGGGDNIFIGGWTDIDSGSANVIIGSNAIGWGSGDNNVIIGYKAAENLSNFSDKLYIGVDNNRLIEGDFSTSRVGIATTPTHTLDVNGDGRFVGNLNLDSTLNIKTSVQDVQSNVDIDIATSPEVVATISNTSYDAVFFDYVVKNGTNVRAGTVTGVTDGTSVKYTETSTQDLGDTTDLTLSVDYNSGNIRLMATATSDNWTVKTFIRGI